MIRIILICLLALAAAVAAIYYIPALLPGMEPGRVLVLKSERDLERGDTFIGEREIALAYVRPDRLSDRVFVLPASGELPDSFSEIKTLGDYRGEEDALEAILAEEGAEAGLKELAKRVEPGFAGLFRGQEIASDLPQGSVLVSGDLVPEMNLERLVIQESRVTGEALDGILVDLEQTALDAIEAGDLVVSGGRASQIESLLWILDSPADIEPGKVVDFDFIASAVDAKQNNLRANFDAEINEIEAEHRGELTKAKRAHAAEMAEIRTAHAEEMDSILEKCTACGSEDGVRVSVDKLAPVMAERAQVFDLEIVKPAHDVRSVEGLRAAYVQTLIQGIQLVPDNRDEVENEWLLEFDRSEERIWRDAHAGAEAGLYELRYRPRGAHVAPNDRRTCVNDACVILLPSAGAGPAQDVEGAEDRALEPGHQQTGRGSGDTPADGGAEGAGVATVDPRVADPFEGATEAVSGE